MNARFLRGLAVLTFLVCLVAPRASAITITFGPNHSAAILDVTLSVLDGEWIAAPSETFGRRWQQPSELAFAIVDGWRIDVIAPWKSFGLIGFRRSDGLFFGYSIGEVFDLGNALPHWWTGIPSQPGWQTWAGKPILAVPDTATAHFTWTIPAVPAPDGGTSAVMLAGALAGLFAIRHRRREIPRPRAMNGV